MHLGRLVLSLFGGAAFICGSGSVSRSDECRADAGDRDAGESWWDSGKGPRGNPVRCPPGSMHFNRVDLNFVAVQSAFNRGHHLCVRSARVLRSIGAAVAVS
jgi:hypothetical protein